MLDLLLDEFINYLATVKAYSPRTLPSYRSYLTRFFTEMKIKIPADITPDKCETYMGRRIARGLSHNSNAPYMNAIRAFLIFCNKHGYGAFQIDMFEVPRRKRVRTEFVTADEVERMVDVTYWERDRLIMLVLFTSGCRVSELVQMSVENFTDNKFTCMVKGGKEHVYYFDPAVADRLRQFMAMNHIVNGPVFRTTNGKPIHIPAITHIVRKATKLANISHNVHPHQFRHGFGTALLEAGADIRTAQEMMGHENVQTTMRYLHVTDRRLKETHQRFAPKVGQPYQFPIPKVPKW